MKVPVEFQTLIEDHRFQARKLREEGQQALARASALEGAAEALERRWAGYVGHMTEDDAREFVRRCDAERAVFEATGK